MRRWSGGVIARGGAITQDPPLLRRRRRILHSRPRSSSWFLDCCMLLSSLEPWLEAITLICWRGEGGRKNNCAPPVLFVPSPCQNLKKLGTRTPGSFSTVALYARCSHRRVGHGPTGSEITRQRAAAGTFLTAWVTSHEWIRSLLQSAVAFPTGDPSIYVSHR
jgi:hypothetical protein